MTAVACFVLAIPNRYLPILQEGKIDTLRAKFGTKYRRLGSQVEAMTNARCE